MRASLIFSSTSHSINVQKVWTYFTCHITQLTNLTRFSKSSSAKPLTSNALFLRLKISANRFYCTNLYSRLLGDSRQYRNGLMMYVERCHALMINPSTTISPLRHKIFLNTSCSMRRHNLASNVGSSGSCLGHRAQYLSYTNLTTSHYSKASDGGSCLHSFLECFFFH